MYTQQQSNSSIPVVDFSNLHRENTRFGGQLIGAKFMSTMARGAQFTRANLTGADLRFADFRHSEWYQCTIRNAELEGSDFREAQFTGCEFRNVALGFGVEDYAAAKFTNCKFYNVFVNVRCPEVIAGIFDFLRVPTLAQLFRESSTISEDFWSALIGSWDGDQAGHLLRQCSFYAINNLMELIMSHLTDDIRMTALSYLAQRKETTQQ